LSDLNDFIESLGISAGRCDLDAVARLLGAALEAEAVVIEHGQLTIRNTASAEPLLSQARSLAVAGEPVNLPARAFADGTATLEVGVPAIAANLLFSREESEFSADEAEFAAAVAREAGMAIGGHRNLRESAELRGDLEMAGRRVERLQRDLETSQGLLDRLSQIEELISSRPPIDQLLESVVSGASYLIEADGIEIHLDDTGPDPIMSTKGRPSTVGFGSTSSLAMSEDRLVIGEEPPKEGAPKPLSEGSRVMAAPIRVAARVIGCLTSYRRLSAPSFTSGEQESLIALSMHASIALQDSRAVEAMRMSLDRERHRSEHDYLTGLPNRVTVLERLDHEIEAADNHPVTVLFIDIDDFKLTNDTLGHRAGDEVLTVVADRIRSAVRDQDLVGRVAADEFVVVCGGITEIGAGELARRIQDRVALPMRVSGRDHLVTVSVGVAGGTTSESAEKLVANADLAASRAKDLGRSRVEVFDVGLRRTQHDRLATLHELRAALRSDQLTVFLQPVVTLPERQVVSFEALVRWNHPRRGLLAPDEFIPLAEETELIAKIDRHVIDTTLALISTNSMQRPVAVNVSARTLAEPGLIDWIRSRLIAHGVEARLMVVEITETVLLGPTRIATGQLQKLRELGVKVVLDDFGTGYSSLATLQNFEVDGVKIDRRFVSILGMDVRADAIVSAVFHMAAAIGLTVVAEGVETDDQADRLVQLRDDSGGVNLCGQGFLFGRPAEGSEVVRGFLELTTTPSWMASSERR